MEPHKDQAHRKTCPVSYSSYQAFLILCPLISLTEKISELKITDR